MTIRCAPEHTSVMVAPGCGPHSPRQGAVECEQCEAALSGLDEEQRRATGLRVEKVPASRRRA